MSTCSPTPLPAPRPPLSAELVPPTPQETLAAMGIPSAGELRGQKDTFGFASRADQMARVWEWSALPPAPESLGPKPAPGVAGIICPHDDYLIAGRVYREVVPLVRAKTIVLVGVFHKYRRFGAHDVMVFDPYRAWRSPDGDIRISDLRDEVLNKLAPEEYVQESAWHDSEHSLEAVAYWLKHQEPAVEILPVILPAAPFPRLRGMAEHLGAALAPSLRQRELALGRDVAVVISSDGTHYGADFGYTPYGEGGVDTFQRAMAADRDLMRDILSGPVDTERARRFYEAMVDPDQPDTYRRTWCGRFSVPFGMVLLQEIARGLGLRPPTAMPVALGASVDCPELPVRGIGMGPTCPISLYHFVTAPAVAFAN